MSGFFERRIHAFAYGSLCLSLSQYITWRKSNVARYVLPMVENNQPLSPHVHGRVMDIEENVANDLGDETPYMTRGPARASHDEDSVSYIKPIITELVRTQVCFPNIKLLVDKISVVKVPSATESSGLEAYRMYLTDREKTIQGLYACYLFLSKAALMFPIYQLS